jgi:hypothetical protein
MTIKIVERGTLVQCEGPVQDVFDVVETLNVPIATLAVKDGNAVALWARD